MRVIFHLPGHELLFGEAAAKLSEIRRKEAPVQKEKKKRVAPVQAKKSGVSKDAGKGRKFP
jgi:hypothetical protein